MKKVCILGSTGSIGKSLVEYYREEYCIEASRSLKTCKNKIHVDLSDFQSVCHFINRILDEKIDFLFLNSGVYELKKFTRDGYEYNFMVNAFSPYYIAKRVLSKHPQCVIIFTSSISILHAQQDLNPKKWNRIYRNTKLIAHMLLNSLEGLFPNSIVSYAHPGIVPSRLSFKLHSKPIRKLIQFFGNTSSNGAKCLIEASKISFCKNSWIVPKGIFSLKGKPKLKKIKRSLDMREEMQKYILKIEKELETKYGV